MRRNNAINIERIWLGMGNLKKYMKTSKQL